MGKTFLAPALTLLLDVARANGVDPKPLLQKHTIDPWALRRPNARLRLDSVLRFFEDLERRFPEPSAGLSASRFWNPNAMGPLGYAWLTSRTLRAAFHRLARFNHIVSEGGSITMVERAAEGLVALRVDLVRPDIAPFLRMDASLALILAMTQALAGRDFTPAAVALAHPAPADTRPYAALFGCPVAFDAAHCEFAITLEAAEAPRTTTPPQLEQLHDRAMIEYMGRLKEENVVERAKAAMIDLLPSGGVTDARVAHELCMTPRTLQRRLREEGTTFKRLLTELRMELAEHYLGAGRYTLSEISFLLGFSELSAFSRAFKRWTGRAPSEYLPAPRNRAPGSSCTAAGI